MKEVLRTLILFDEYPEKIRFAVVHVSAEDYVILSRAHGVMLNTIDNDPLAEKSANLISLAFEKESGYSDYSYYVTGSPHDITKEEYHRWLGTFEVLESPPTDISDIDRFISCGILV